MRLYDFGGDYSFKSINHRPVIIIILPNFNAWSHPSFKLFLCYIKYGDNFESSKRTIAEVHNRFLAKRNKIDGRSKSREEIKPISIVLVVYAVSCLSNADGVGLCRPYKEVTVGLTQHPRE